MRTVVKREGKRKGKRDLFAELTEGMAALAESREGKRTLRTHSVEFKPAPTITPQQLIRVRESLNMSRALFAGYLRTNVRTLENWEQGSAKPNAQAALLINLLRLFRIQSSDWRQSKAARNRDARVLPAAIGW